jgi:hypothetical protein
MLFGRFDPNTTYHYRACYLPFMLNDRGVNPSGPSLMRCGQDRTFTPALAVTPPS